MVIPGVRPHPVVRMDLHAVPGPSTRENSPVVFLSFAAGVLSAGIFHSSRENRDWGSETTIFCKIFL